LLKLIAIEEWGFLFNLSQAAESVSKPYITYKEYELKTYTSQTVLISLKLFKFFVFAFL